LKLYLVISLSPSRAGARVVAAGAAGFVLHQLAHPLSGFGVASVVDEFSPGGGELVVFVEVACEYRDGFYEAVVDGFFQVEAELVDGVEVFVAGDLA